MEVKKKKKEKKAWVNFAWLQCTRHRTVRITVAHGTTEMMIMLIWVRLICRIAGDAVVNPISPGSPDLLAAAPSAIIYNPFTSTECVSCRA